MQSDSSLFASVAYSPVHLYTHIGVFSWIPSLLNGLSFIMTIILLPHWPLTDTIRAFSGDFFTPLTSRNTLRLPLFVWYHAVLQSTLHLPCSGVARCPREARLKSWRAALGGARSGCWLRAGLQGFWTCSAGGTENAHVRACPCPLRATSLSLLLTKVSIYDLMLVSHTQHRGSAVPHIAKSPHPQCGHYL